MKCCSEAEWGAPFPQKAPRPVRETGRLSERLSQILSLSLTVYRGTSLIRNSRDYA